MSVVLISGRNTFDRLTAQWGSCCPSSPWAAVGFNGQTLLAVHEIAQSNLEGLKCGGRPDRLWLLWQVLIIGGVAENPEPLKNWQVGRLAS
jgi:hypothetical protein